MMRLWRESYTRRAIMLLTASGAVSIVVHSVIIGGAVFRTKRPPDLPGEGLANKVYYIPPPDRSRAPGSERETVRYISMANFGIGVGAGAGALDAKTFVIPDASPMPGTLVADSSGTRQAPPAPVASAGRDSVYSVLDVDTAVVRAENSAAPAYPLALLKKGITGSVAARYVVDTTGFADTSSFEVLRSTHPDFIAAVRAALPYMRFSPAKNGPHRVRQLVEQEFTFKITANDLPPIKPGEIATQRAPR